MKVVINRCYGGFSLSEKAYEYLGIPWDGYGYKFRDDEDRANRNNDIPYITSGIETNI